MNDQNTNQNDANEIAFEVIMDIAPIKGGTVGEDTDLTVNLYLPVTRDKFAEILQGAGFDNPETCDFYFYSLYCGIDELEKLIPHAAVMSYDTFNELNYLAAEMQKLDEISLNLFMAAIDQRNLLNTNIADLINMIENIQHYNIIPVHTTKELGEVFTLHKLNFAVLTDLERSDSPEVRGFAEEIQLLIDHANRETLGQAIAKKEKGIFTPYGYLTLDEADIKQVYRSSNDIPQEYNIMPADHPPVKAENVELSSFLIKLHALAGLNIQEAGKTIKTLQEKPDHFLILTNNKNIYISDYAQPYHNDSDAYSVWRNWAELPGVMALEVEVTDQGNKSIYGNITMLDCKKQLEDIMAHCITPIRFDVTLANGQRNSITPVMWNTMSFWERKKLAGYEPVYDFKAKADLTAHLQETYQSRHKNALMLTPVEFLTKINQSYMQQAIFKYGLSSYHAPCLRARTARNLGMLRIPHQIAVELLVRGNVDVYQIEDSGIRDIPRMTVLRHQSQDWCKHYEFAVRPNAMDEINRWAEGQRNTIMQRLSSQWDTLDKHKNKEQER